jgi:hypothetical protein
MAIRYQHTQTGETMRWIVGVALAIPLVIATISVRNDPSVPQWVWLAIAIPMLLAVLGTWMFSRLTVALDEHSLRWYFGGGIPRFSMSRGEIRGARPIKAPWYFGMGIHYIPGRPGKWIYNVGLGRAVEITKLDGSMIYLGSDDPDGLVAALTAR